MDITWLGHSSFKIKTLHHTIYIDPYEGDYSEPADIILMTHDHHDHADANKVKEASLDDTIIITTEKNSSRFLAKIIKPGQEIKINDVIIKAVPSYNINKPFHPQSLSNVGFIISIEGKTVYHAGDTDLIPEMKDIKADIALLPVGGTYTMDSKQAAEAAMIIKPHFAIPMHYGSIVGNIEDAMNFKDLLEHTEITVKILNKEEVFSI